MFSCGTYCNECASYPLHPALAIHDVSSSVEFIVDVGKIEIRIYVEYVSTTFVKSNEPSMHLLSCIQAIHSRLLTLGMPCFSFHMTEHLDWYSLANGLIIWVITVQVVPSRH